MCLYVMEKGWPNTAMVIDPAGAETKIAPDTKVNFEEPTGFRIRGIGRAPRSVLRVGAQERRCFNVVGEADHAFECICGDPALQARFSLTANQRLHVG